MNGLGMLWVYGLGVFVSFEVLKATNEFFVELWDRKSWEDKLPPR